MRLNVSHSFLPKQNSVRASVVMDHFGVDFEQGRHVIAENLEMAVGPGEVVLFTGPSGSGKSSLMRALANALHQSSPTAPLDPGPSSLAPLDEMPADSHQRSPAAPLDPGPSPLAPLNIDALDLGDRILIDALPVPVEEAMNLLSSCGLGEAHLMLRTPAELSDGQRYRFRLAAALAQRPRWILADEFTATLDRTLAKVVAYNIRRTADRTGVGFLMATTHEDIAADLDPDVHVRCRLDGGLSIVRRGETDDPTQSAEAGSPTGRPCRKKKVCRSSTTCGSPPRPSAIGRTSLGGITAAIKLG